MGETPKTYARCDKGKCKALAFPRPKPGKEKSEDDDDLFYVCAKDKDNPCPMTPTEKSNCACFIVVYHVVQKKVEGKDKPGTALVLLDDEKYYAPEGGLSKAEWTKIRKKVKKEGEDYWSWDCACLKLDKDKKPFYEES